MTEISKRQTKRALDKTTHQRPTVTSEMAYEGSFINVRIDTIQTGDTTLRREILEEAGDGVLIAAVDDENRVALIQQSRHIYGVIYEVPAGAMKPGEDPLVAAQRELLEEAGITANSWKLLSTHTNGVHMTGTNYYYLATDLQQNHETAFDPDEVIAPVEFHSFDEVDRLIQENKIPDLRNRGCLWLTKLSLLESGALPGKSPLSDK